MPKGSLPGERRGGRQKGTPNRATAAKAAAIAASGLTPLDYLLSVMRDETAPRAERMEAAAKAAPYIHPRLAAIEHTASTIPDEPPFDASKLSREQRAMLRQMLELRLALTGQAVPPQLEATGTDYVLDNDD